MKFQYLIRPSYGGMAMISGVPEHVSVPRWFAQRAANNAAFCCCS